MVAEYIERQAAIEAFENGEADVIESYGDGCDFGFGLKNIKDVLSAIPAADAAPVRHGHWVDKPTGRYRQWQSWCSVCENRSGIGGIESNQHKPYCPNCGARMDGGADK